MQENRIILETDRFNWVISRLCHQLIEDYGNFENTCLIGIQPRGTLFSDRIVQALNQILPIQNFAYGKLDITFYRDDFRMRDKPLKANVTEMDFLVDHKRVILIDDVLYTGRTISAALAALANYGRPDSVRLLALVDRRFNRHLPIRCDYKGITVDSLDEAYVKVEWASEQGQDRILIYPEKTD
ncbi:MAG: bifunctional pyr operon transcriptional regulator/uracil phosphoribosyltransferase PyrR [Saprospiraceae bacterium]